VLKRTPSNSPFEVLNYKIGNKKYELLLRDFDTARYRRYWRTTEVYQKLKLELSKYINLASLSVYRLAYGIQAEEDLYARRASRDTDKPAVDRYLKELMSRFTSYQLALSEEANAISSNFQKDVLVSVLFNEKFDSKLDIGSLNPLSSEQEEGLMRAYRELGVLDEHTKEKIKDHVEVLNLSLRKVKQYISKKDKPKLEIRDLLPLPLFRRTQHIIDLSLKAESAKQKKTEPIHKYINMLQEFMDDKRLSIRSKTGEFLITKDEKEINIFDLSSGEKQLLILLTETLLQKQQPYIFLADEPEISLHIEWQAKVVSSIRSINPSSQVIVATHSPEIASEWSDNIIDMEDIVSA